MILDPRTTRRPQIGKGEPDHSQLAATERVRKYPLLSNQQVDRANPAIRPKIGQAIGGFITVTGGQLRLHTIQVG